METTLRLTPVFRALNPLNAPELYYRYFSKAEKVIDIGTHPGSAEKHWRFEHLMTLDDHQSGFRGDVMIDRASGHAVILYKGMDVPFKNEGNGRLAFLRDAFTAAQSWFQGGINQQTPFAEQLYLKTLYHPDVKSIQTVGFSLGTLHVNYIAAKYGVQGTVASDLGIADKGLTKIFNTSAKGILDKAKEELHKNITVLRMGFDLIPRLFGAGPSRGEVIDLDEGWLPDLSGLAHLANIYSIKARKIAQSFRKAWSMDVGMFNLPDHTI